jgi:hypothetical protein
LTDESNVYYCNHCKTIIEQLEDLLFVEDGNSKGFCSENCIEKFYQHLVVYFEDRDKEFREELSLLEEDCLKFVGKPKLMELVLSSPHEVFRITNDLKEEYFHFIRKVSEKGSEAFSLIATCLIFENKPSFILAVTATRNEKLIAHYQKGQIVDRPLSLEVPVDDEGFQSVEVDEELIESIELKKSIFLAGLLEERSPSDIPFEKFNMYDEFIEKTLQEPDEVFLDTDEEGDKVLTYIKAHELNGTSFYYFCLCMKYEAPEREGMETLLPILTFPSLDGELYEHYKKGTKLTGALKS